MGNSKLLTHYTRRVSLWTSYPLCTVANQGCDTCHGPA